MNEAQRVTARIKTGGYRRDIIEASDYIAIGSFEGYRSYYYADGSRLWTNADSCGACPPSDAPREANYAMRGD